MFKKIGEIKVEKNESLDDMIGQQKDVYKSVDDLEEGSDAEDEDEDED